MGDPEFIKQQETPPACPHKPYCPADCGECDGEPLDAAKAILEARRRAR